MGGYHHASAYCLMYVDEGSEKLFQGDCMSSMKDLAKDLQMYVSSDNLAFHKEKESWDIEQSCKKDCSTMTTDSSDTSTSQEYVETTSKVSSVGSSMHFSLHSPQLEHASLTLKQTEAKLGIILKEPVHDWQRLIAKMIHQELSDLRQKAHACPDSRVDFVVVYFIQNEVPIDLLNIAILEQFAHPDLNNSLTSNANVEQFQRQSKELLHTTWSKLSKEKQQIYQEWHKRYSSFRKVITSFVLGMEMFQLRRYEEALQYFLHSFSINSQLIATVRQRICSFETGILGHFRRKCVLKLNEKAVSRFQQEEPPFESVTPLIDEFVVPSMTFLGAPNASKIDSDAAVQIRDSWCSMIDFQCTEEKRQFLEEVITKLCELQKEAQICKPSVSLRLTDLHSKYIETMKIVKRELQFVGSETMQ